jgi:hypothetical protein
MGGIAMASAKTTVDHDEIREWVEDRGGFPAHVRRTGDNEGDLGVLRIDYPGFTGTDTLERIDWDPWFEAFDSNKLAFLYQDEGDSRFSKLVDRGSVKSSARKASSAKKASSKKAAPAKKSSAKKAASSKKAAPAKKAASSKKAAPAKKASAKKASSKKAASARKASPAKKASVKKSSSARKASPAKKAAPSRKATTTKKASSTKKAASSKKKAAPAKKAAVAKKATTSASSAKTTNHAKIQKWVEARGGYPARVKSTGKKNDPGILRIDFPGYSGAGTLERIDWDEWFEWFDRDKLAFLYQDKRNSRFSKLIRR